MHKIPKRISLSLANLSNSNWKRLSFSIFFFRWYYVCATLEVDILFVGFWRWLPSRTECCLHEFITRLTMQFNVDIFTTNACHFVSMYTLSLCGTWCEPKRELLPRTLWLVSFSSFFLYAENPILILPSTHLMWLSIKLAFDCCECLHFGKPSVLIKMNFSKRNSSTVQRTRSMLTHIGQFKCGSLSGCH